MKLKIWDLKWKVNVSNRKSIVFIYTYLSSVQETLELELQEIVPKRREKNAICNYLDCT